MEPSRIPAPSDRSPSEVPTALPVALALAPHRVAGARRWLEGSLGWQAVEDATDAPVPPVLRLADVVGAAARGLGGPEDQAAPLPTLLPALDAAAEAEDDAARAARAVTVATAQARTVAIGLVAAPVLLVPVIGRLAGADVLMFYAAGIGRAVLAVGGTLLAAGALLSRALVRRAAAAGGSGSDAGFEEAVELVATALGGAAGPAAALRTVAERVDGPPARHAPMLRTLALEIDLGVDPATTRAERGGAGRLRASLGLAAEGGAPAGPVLRRLARDLRAEELTRVLAAAERLPAQLTVPATLLLLPASVLLIAAPLLDAGLRTVTG